VGCGVIKWHARKRTIRDRIERRGGGMFLGDYQHTLDAKGRVSLPAKFRSEMTERVVVVKGFEGCLYVYPASQYATFLARVMDGNDFDPKIRSVRRFFTAGAKESDVDAAGRVSLPPVLRDYAGLVREVDVIGNGDRIEIWDAEKWAAYNGETSGTIEDDAGELAAKGVL
jgi:MraZ protein